MRTVVAAALSVLLAAPAAAQTARVGNLTVRDAQVRASLGATPNTAAYLRVDNPTPRPDRLIGAACGCARAVELHRTIEAGGTARMERVAAFDVASVGGLTLGPGGGHLMLLSLRRPLRAGERVPLTLRFERYGTVTVNAIVTSRPAVAADPHAHH